VIGLIDAPDELYGKLMSLGDDSIIPMFTLLTDTPEEEIKKFNVKSDAMVLKKKVARMLVENLHDKKSAERAEENFTNTFQKKEIPEKIEEIEMAARPVDTVVTSGAATTTSVARRLFEEGAIVDLNTEKKLTLKDNFESGHVYRIGKHRFIKIK
jgi:tyrosyl-tRNA synthetase